MLGFDALGRLALGQGADQAETTVVLVADTRVIALSGIAVVFIANSPLNQRPFALLGSVTASNIRAATTAGSFTLLAQAVQLGVSGALGAAAFDLSVKDSAFWTRMSFAREAFNLAGDDAPSTASINATAATEFSVTGFGTSFSIIFEWWILVPGDPDTWTERPGAAKPWAAAVKLSETWVTNPALSDGWTQRNRSSEVWTEEKL
jgi:hypothetical protein